MQTTFTNVEFGGRFVRLGSRVRPYFDALKNGESAENIQKMVKNDFAIDLARANIKFFLENIFLRSGMVVDFDKKTDQYKILPKHSAARRHNDVTIRLKITLLPCTTVKFISDKLKFLYTKPALTAFSILALANIVLILTNGMPASIERIRAMHFSGADFWIAAPILLVSFVFHELGHSTAALVGGVKPGRIGFGIYWIYPVLFSDVTNTWGLEPKKRVLVDVGGVYFQSFFTVIIGILIHLSGEKLGYSLAICFLCNAVSILISIIPVLRYDGYWVIADYLDCPCLSKIKANEIIGIFFSDKTSNKVQIASGDIFKKYVLLGYFVMSKLCFFAFILLLFFNLKNSTHLLTNEILMLEEAKAAEDLLKIAAKILIYSIPLLLAPYVAIKMARPAMDFCISLSQRLLSRREQE